MLNSVTAAQHSHHFIYRGFDVATSGNELAHTILRGGVNKFGQTQPNYHYEELVRLAELYNQWNLKNPAVIVDVNHSNSGKQYKEQIRIVSEVLHSRNYNSDLKKLVKGCYDRKLSLRRPPGYQRSYDSRLLHHRSLPWMGGY